jgi:hypothetical protein
MNVSMCRVRAVRGRTNALIYAAIYRLQLAEVGVITSLVTLIAKPDTSPDIREHALRLLYNISLEGIRRKEEESAMVFYILFYAPVR